MKKFILLLIVGVLSTYGFSINPIDPQTKKVETGKTITQSLPVTINECSDLNTLVTVNVTVTYTDCPFDCLSPCSSFCIRLTDGTNYYGTKLWNGSCTYYFDNLRIEENTTIWIEFYNPGGCTVVWNSNKSTTMIVPSGGGNLYCTMLYCP